MKPWFQDNDTEMNSKHNEGKSVIVKRFDKILKNKIYKCITAVSKNVYIDKLDYIINRYNNTYHSTTNIKHSDVNPNRYIDFNVEKNERDSNLELGDHAVISKYKNNFAKVYIPNWSRKELYVNR